MRIVPIPSTGSICDLSGPSQLELVEDSRFSLFREHCGTLHDPDKLETLICLQCGAPLKEVNSLRGEKR